MFALMLHSADVVGDNHGRTSGCKNYEQDKYNEGYAAGAASVTPEDGVTQADVDAAAAAALKAGIHEGKKKGSGGLSDGAVAGIAVGCAVAGIAVGCVIGAVASQLIRRPKTPPELDPAKSNL